MCNVDIFTQSRFTDIRKELEKCKLFIIFCAPTLKEKTVHFIIIALYYLLLLFYIALYYYFISLL